MGCQLHKNIVGFKAFEVRIIESNKKFFFGTCVQDEKQAEVERSNWMLAIVDVIAGVASSLFPDVYLACYPIPTVPSTERRVLAGVLLHFDGEHGISACYCELHSQREGRAELVLYENQFCEQIILEIPIHVSTSCTKLSGFPSAAFMLDDHTFAGRSEEESSLWMRAISNVVVKIQNDAADPTPAVGSVSAGHCRPHRVAAKRECGQAQVCFAAAESLLSISYNTWLCTANLVRCRHGLLRWNGLHFTC